jgi:hypothetical protein
MKSVLAAGFAAFVLVGVPASPGAITKTERGARVETDKLAAEIRDGVVVSIVNKLTGEEYIDPATDMNNVIPHLPCGLGSQATDPEREAAFTLYKWPWWEHPAESLWPNHHSPSAASKVEFKAKDESAATVTYTGLSDGSKTYPDETLTLELAIDPETRDLLITPVARSPRPGVYSSSLPIAPLGPAITAEAPIFDGLQLDRNMKPMLWVNQWGGYWDYAFLAFNGYKKGAVAVWCQDADLKFYKYLHYLINPEGISFSFTTFNVPPFDKLTEAGAMTWRIQAFDKGWSQAVARFRDWRLKNVKIAPRPAVASRISFVNGGVNAGKMWVDYLEQYLGSNDLDRTATFGATIRAEGFDRNHANNTPYKGFRDDMKYWKQKGCKMMAYLQPMIMWGPNPTNDRERAAVEYHKKADTVAVFQKPGEAKTIAYVDQHHLGQPEWQRWFLDWVKEYIQDYGSDGVYHDQSYHCPVDSRGLAVGGKTTTQGMADYFYKAQAESPESFHGTEHMMEVNNVGASLGIGSGILWGTAESMRKQRIDHPSPVCNALHWPNGAIFAFPHYSQITSHQLQRIHWGMNLSEGRGELAYAALQSGEAARTQGLVNERWMDVVRSGTFVHKGLRAVFPEDWDRGVLSYFKGAKGEDVRYIRTAWGSAFVEIAGGKTNLLYGRIHGTPYAQVGGGIAGWPFYNAKGPAGLNPNRYYVLDPNAKRPAAYFSSCNQFSPSLYEGFVEEGFSDDAFAYITIKPREDILNIITYDAVILNAPEAPKAVFVNGAAAKANPVTNGQWRVDFQLAGPVSIVAILKDGATSVPEAGSNAVSRVVAHDWAIDQYWPARGLGKTGGDSDCVAHLVLCAPADQGEGAWALNVSARLNISRVELNGMPVPSSIGAGANYSAQTAVKIAMKPGEQGLLSVYSGGQQSVTGKWEPRTPPAASTNAPAAK